jgi:hypothetical protein
MLLDAKPPKPPSGIRKYVPLPVLILSVVVLGLIAGLLSFRFWNYRQEQAVAHFLNTLEAGDYPTAYKLWQPAPSYSFQDFLHDWGEQGDYGKIRGFEILGSHALSGTVLVTVRINNREDSPCEIAVDRKTLGLAFSPFF